MITMKQAAPALLGVVLTSTAAQAVPVIPEDSGWSGHVRVGVGAGSSKSNMLAGLGSSDLGGGQISGLDQGPDNEDIAVPAVGFEVAYTFVDSYTQFYLGNSVEDALTFDLRAHLGIRQAIPDVGRIDLSLSFSTLPTDVWKDPYIVNQKRGDTERTSTGIYLAWDEILGTALELTYGTREIKLDDERSGEDAGLSLSSDDTRLLRRTGNSRRVDLAYKWQINEQHRLEPVLGYVDADLDGEAMAEDGLVLQLRHFFQQGRWRLVNTVAYEDLQSNTVNPIYAKERDLHVYGGSVTAFYSAPFGWQSWTATGGVSYYKGDSNIDFYDSSVGLVSIGMSYRFQ